MQNDERKTDDKDSAEGGGGGFVAGFILGALAGGALAMVLAPQTGEETRDLVREKAREAGGLAKDKAGGLREVVQGFAGGVQSGLSEYYARGKRVVEDARSNVDAAVDEGRSAAATQRREFDDLGPA